MEPGHSVVSGADSSGAFDSPDTNTDMRLPNHLLVVGTVPHSQRDGVLCVFDQLDDVRFLVGVHTAAHHALASCSHFEELLCELFVFGNDRVAGRQNHQPEGARQVGQHLHFQRLLQLLVQSLFLCCVQLQQGTFLLHRALEQVASHADVDSGLHLVPCQHPHLDASLQKHLDRLGHKLLELVLDSCGTQQQQPGIFLDLLLQQAPPAVVLAAPLEMPFLLRPFHARGLHPCLQLGSPACTWSVPPLSILDGSRHEECAQALVPELDKLLESEPPVGLVSFERMGAVPFEKGFYQAVCSFGEHCDSLVG
mmetsp:Transcript_1573/g.2049  ORF Transcript_1573/g.2049 Transcript_1573/m.2049 type:complete len:309 (-) Transcript_1573:172-1098(-)